jgi:bacillithiol biosynthesis cysteine-adding enzyme BshC
VDYAAAKPAATKFYARGFDTASVLEAAAQTTAHPHADRQALVQILRDQQSLWGADAAADANVEKLADPRAAVIITGQQVGLFTGPTYTVLKALTTVLMARKLEAISGRPFVPVFWLGSEDHDFGEMATTWVPGPVQLTVPRPDVANTGPVGALKFGPEISGLLATLEGALQGTDFRATVMEMARETYAEGTTFRDAFARMLRALLPDTGLVIFAQDDPRAKKLAAPVWQKEIEDWESSDETLRKASEEIASAYFAQVHIRPTNLFMIHQGARLPVDIEDGQFHLRGTDQSWTRSELSALLEAEPERFSPNVVLRPLTQDWLFPTAAYVGGPGETAYFGQYKGVYEWAGQVMPAILPRVSLTFVEPAIRRTIGKIGLPAEAFSQDPDALFSEVARRRMAFEAEALFGQALSQVDRVVERLAPDVVAVDASLARSVESTRAGLHKQLTRLRARVLKADRRGRGLLRKQIERVANALFPLGKPQERVISPLYFVAKYGPNFFVQLMDDLETDTRVHFLVDL